MLSQLDLFAPSVEESRKPEMTRGRLTPPAVVLVEEKSENPEPESRLMPFPLTGPADEPAAADTNPATFPAEDENLDDVSSVQESSESNEESKEPDLETTKSSTGGAEPKRGNRGRKSIREMSRDASLLEIPSDDQLYSKQYYGIGEVAAMFNVNTSLLRFWESEFDILKPRKNRKGDRFFRPEDIKNLQLIHHLLRERKYTIDGARDFLKKSGRRKEQFEAIESLKKIREFLVGLKAGL